MIIYAWRGGVAIAGVIIYISKWIRRLFSYFDFGKRIGASIAIFSRDKWITFNLDGDFRVAESAPITAVRDILLCDRDRQGNVPLARYQHPCNRTCVVMGNRFIWGGD